MDTQDRESRPGQDPMEDDRDPTTYDRDPTTYGTDNFQEIPGEPDAPRRMRSRLIVLKSVTDKEDLKKVSKSVN